MEIEITRIPMIARDIVIFQGKICKVGEKEYKFGDQFLLQGYVDDVAILAYLPDENSKTIEKILDNLISDFDVPIDIFNRNFIKKPDPERQLHNLAEILYSDEMEDSTEELLP